MCLDVIGCHAVDTVIYDSCVWGIRSTVLATPVLIISSDFFLSPIPSPSPRLSSVCLLDLIPRPRAWEARAKERFAIACSVPACLLPITSCRSLAHRSFATAAAMMSSPPPRHDHDVIGRPVIEPIPPRHIITPRCLPPSVPFPFHVPIAPRLAYFAPVIAPSPDIITPFHPSAASSSSRRHHFVITPAGHVLPASRLAHLVE